MSPSASAGFAARSNAVVVWAPRFMLVYGGRLADGSYSWDLVQRRWSALPDGGPGAYALSAGSDAIIWGGFEKVGGGERLLDDGMIYQPPSRKRVAASISAGFNASCAFVEDGALECWGYRSGSWRPW